MKISELIAELEKAKAEHGDIQVGWSVPYVTAGEVVLSPAPLNNWLTRSEDG